MFWFRKKIHALILVAHPDDESYLFAATCRKFSDEGKCVNIICATKGEMGADRLNRDLNKEQMAKERAEELRCACDVIHIERLEFLDYPDGGLDQVDQNELAGKLVIRIEKYKPTIVMTFGPEGITGHRDHIAMHKATMQACKSAQYKPEEIWMTSVPASMIGEFNEHLARRKVHHAHYIQQELKGVPDEQLTAIPAGKYSDVKLEAIKSHKSQYLPTLVMKNFLTNEYFQIVKNR